ncbi:MAG TPA: sensor histidine kinase [Vicinamibacterales bacterium]|nr:sensor histidine kinase [Vicinamibacterales bacterium]
MRGITGRFVVLIATAAVAPLLIYGVVSVRSLRSGTTQSVGAGNAAVATEIADRIHLYFQNNQRVLGSIASQLQGTQLAAWQQERTLRNHVLDYKEFLEITLFDRSGQVLATSRATSPRLAVPSPRTGGTGGLYIAQPRLDDDGLPTTTMALQISGATPGWIVAEISLEELWRAVDRIRVGDTGFAVLLDETGRIVAHGRADQKRLIASGATQTPEQKLASRLRSDGSRTSAGEIEGPAGAMLAVAARITVPDWTVIVEHPRKEALGVALALERQLVVAIGLALLATVGAGWLWGRSFIRRIVALTRVTRALAAGDMDARVHPRGKDEIRQLGDAFNTMADRLVELQEEIRKQERQAMFGRIAAGLVHDLSHPIQTIGNSCKLIQRIFDDAEYRATFRQTVERELATVKRVLDDLRNIARPMPLEHFSIDANATLAEAVETMTPLAETAGLTLRAELTREPAFIEGDLFALGRVHRNLILNAIQATAPGGLVVVATEATADRVQFRIYDTGCGIPEDRLAAIFDDFVTTKRRGLGLGLAISKKIVEQLGGRISVASEVGKGTTFVLDFPRAHAAALVQIAG